LPAQRAEPAALDGEAEEEREHDDGKKGGGEGQAPDHVEVEHRHRPQHVDLAVGEVDDVQDAVDQCEPEGHEDVEDPREQADGQPLREQGEVDLQATPTYSCRSPPRRPRPLTLSALASSLEASVSVRKATLSPSGAKGSDLPPLPQ